MRYYIVHHDLQKNSHARSHSLTPHTAKPQQSRDSCDIFIKKASSYMYKSMHSVHKVLLCACDAKGESGNGLSLIRHFVTSECAHCISIILFRSFHFHIHSYMLCVCVAMSILKSQILFYGNFFHIQPTANSYGVSSSNFEHLNSIIRLL